VNDQPTEETQRVRGRFRLIERIAAGATAEVWRASDDQLGRPVAVKLLHSHLLPDERSRHRFEAEARSVGALAHPGIVAVYDVDVEGDRPALVLELVDGESLGARLAREGRLDPREAARIGAEVGDALLHAHQRGVVHRDVKPGNILLDPEGRARLVDFGIARSLAENADRLTLTGAVVGTPRYMAPEQLADEPLGPRTDLYALGTVLHEMLTGRPPFAASSPVALAAEQRNATPALEGIDPALAGIVTAALAPDPDRRPRTAGAMADALRDWLAGRPVGPLGAAGPARDLRSEAPTVAAPVAAPVASPAPRRGAEPRWPMLAGGLLGAAAVAGVLLLALMLGSPEGEPPPAVAADPDPTPTLTPTSEPAAAEPDNGPPADAGRGNPGQGGLPRPVARLVDEYHEECGEEAPPPPDLTGMNKKQAEEVMEPLIEACEDDDD
jgi:eukaryotic-like serine/threonine-protein kinase